MPCAAVASSPLFSPSPRKIFCKPPPPPSSPLALKEEVVGSTSMMMLKRKRLMTINIPVPTLGFADVKKTTPDLDRSSEVEFEGQEYAVYCKRGKRGGVMEDRHAAVLNLHGDSKQAFFGVFDGHGGAAAAEFAANNLGENVMNQLLKSSEDEIEIEHAVKEGYLATDSEFLKGEIRGGTCCVTALIRGGDLVVSNAGDCRAVLCRGGVAEALTEDHRPSLVHERQRIENLGGYVDCCRGAWRVHGSLAVSRAIGDRHLKQWVIAEPVTKVLKITPEFEFLIMASDGLWDNVSNQEAVDIVRSSCIGVDKPEAFFACKKLVDLSLTRGSVDDISVMVIQLTKFI